MKFVEFSFGTKDLGSYLKAVQLGPSIPTPETFFLRSLVYLLTFFLLERILLKSEGGIVLEKHKKQIVPHHGRARA